MEMIRNNVSHHLGGRQSVVLDSIGADLASAFYKIRPGTEFARLDWKDVKESLACKTFEMLYPSEDPSLFVVNELDPTPDPECVKVFGKKESQIFEEFVKEFFKYLETPEMSPRLMRKMILIVIDLADIALTQGKANSFKLFERIEIRGGNQVQQCLILLWAVCGVRCNPEVFWSDPRSEKNPQIKVILRILRAELMEDGITSKKKEEVLWVLELWRRSSNEDSVEMDFCDFLKVFDNIYQPLIEDLEPANTDLERKYLNQKYLAKFTPCK